MSKSLFQITEAIKQMDDLLDQYSDEDSTALIKESLDAISEDFKDKAIKIAQYVKSIESDIEVAKGEKTRVEAFKKAQENKLEKVRDYLKTCMLESGLDKIKTPTDSIMLMDGRDMLEVTDPDSIPENFIKIEKTIMKREANEYWKETGIVPAGFSVTHGQPSLRISKPKVEGEENAPKKRGRKKLEVAKVEVETKTKENAVIETAVKEEDSFAPMVDDTEFDPMIELNQPNSCLLTSIPECFDRYMRLDIDPETRNKLNKSIREVYNLKAGQNLNLEQWQDVLSRIQWFLDDIKEVKNVRKY